MPRRLAKRQNSRGSSEMDSDADPFNPQRDIDTSTSSSEKKTSADEYDVDTYLAEELRLEGLKLSSFLSLLRDSRFVDCGQVLMGGPVRQQPVCRFTHILRFIC